MKKRRFPIPFRYLLPVVVLLCALIGGAVAKYVTTEKVEGTVTFTASLAESVVVREHTVTHNADGSYSLNDTDDALITEGVKYDQLIPGLDIPKDPHVVITGKTSIPAYLFIEVVDEDTDENDALTYAIELNKWQPVTITGKKVYVYTGEGTETTAKTITNDDMDADGKLTVHILKDNTVYVSQTLKTAGIKGTLSFTAKLVEVQTGVSLQNHYDPPTAGD